jgi:ferritin-like metal-binding protein YciE
MGLFSNEEFNSMSDLLIEQLKDLYDAEQQLMEALPKMADAANSSTLKDAFSSHLEQTQGHVARLEEAFAALGLRAERQTCKAMKGLIAEGSDVISAKGDKAVRDAALIAAAQRVEHYEIAGYGTARTFSEQLGLPQVTSLLEQTLGEEKEADEKLTAIAIEKVNPKALGKIAATA